MRFLRHLLSLLREFFEFAWHNKAWWIVPIVLVFLVVALFVIAGQGSSLQFLYTIF